MTVVAASGSAVAASAHAYWHRAHTYKALACVVFVLIALQYLLSGAIDRRSIETIFTINTSRPPHRQRGLSLYGPATASSIVNDEAAAAADDETAALGGAAALVAGSIGGNLTLTGLPSTSAAQLPTAALVGGNNTTAGPAQPQMLHPRLANSTVGSSGTPAQQQQQQQEEELAGSATRSRNNASSSSSVAGGGGSTPAASLVAAPNASSPRESMASCPLVPPNLVGPIAVSKSPPELKAMEKAFERVRPGGRGRPDSCQPRHRVAIVIPFRDRFQHLMTLLYNLHPLLLRQQLDYQIFVVEQEGSWQFNRAMLMNVGYVEALKERPFDCFIFHDVDLLPEDDRNLYTCPEQPRHMSVAIDKFLYRLPYSDLFGGVSAMTTEHFRLVNGFSNVFWGWGGEDDDMANRIKARGLHISRYPPNIARYKMLTHKKEKANPKRYEFLKSGKKRFFTDGLSNLQYELLEKKKPKLYTSLLVQLTPPTQSS